MLKNFNKLKSLYLQSPVAVNAFPAILNHGILISCHHLTSIFDMVSFF